MTMLSILVDSEDNRMALRVLSAMRVRERQADRHRSTFVFQNDPLVAPRKVAWTGTKV